VHRLMKCDGDALQVSRLSHNLSSLIVISPGELHFRFCIKETHREHIGRRTCIHSLNERRHSFFEVCFINSILNSYESAGMKFAKNLHFLISF